jgi:hypothetical protein
MKCSLFVATIYFFSGNVFAGFVYPNATVTFGGVTPDYDNSLLTSPFLAGVTANDLANTGLLGISNNGLFIETFDTATQLGTNIPSSPFSAGSQAFNSATGVNSNCAMNSTGGGVDVSGSISVREDNLRGVALIGYDNNCFGYTPEDGQRTGQVTIDFTPLLANLSLITSTEVALDYLGFYWATIDTYNTFTFSYEGVDILHMTGTDLKDSISNLQLGSTNQYVNVAFSEGIYFDQLDVLSTRRAAEFDNLVSRIITVSEPPSSTLFFATILMLGFTAFKKTLNNSYVLIYKMATAASKG